MDPSFSSTFIDLLHTVFDIIECFQLIFNVLYVSITTEKKENDPISNMVYRNKICVFVFSFKCSLIWFFSSFLFMSIIMVFSQ